MKKTPFIIALVLTFVLEVIGCYYFIGRPGQVKQDPVAVNECLYSIEENFGTEEQYSTVLAYTILDNRGTVLYTNKKGMSSSLNEAIQNQDLIMDLVIQGETKGKVIFDNDMAEIYTRYRKYLFWFLIIALAVQLIVVGIYYIYLRRTIITPFQKLNEFAVRVADGNFDLPLLVDRKHIFGGFTEAFDLMRTELKKARIAEKKANDDKKEMIAKLSHDIKTPVASIKSTSEVGLCLTQEERVREKFELINRKTDQISGLVDNLFQASVEEITELSVNPGNHPSALVKELILNSDYLERTEDFAVPNCRIYVDRLRLQQAFDNVFMNSYKYAGTRIEVSAECQKEYLIVRIADRGPGVKPEELPVLKEKYKRGSNVHEQDGAGLGLYLTNLFIEKMDGKLVLENGEPGFIVYVYIRLAG